jgi:sec-independent protein translocase protein TatB
MEILGIGPSELVFVVIIALIVLGPKDMQKAGRSLGKWLRQIVTSDGWKLFQQTSREIQTLPNRLMREAAVEELKESESHPSGPPAMDRRVGTSPDTRPALPQAAKSPESGPGSEPSILAASARPNPTADNEHQDA